MYQHEIAHALHKHLSVFLSVCVCICIYLCGVSFLCSKICFGGVDGEIYFLARSVKGTFR